MPTAFHNGAPCDDGNDCTYNDSCFQGSCFGTTVYCFDNPSDPCHSQRCNGTSVCTLDVNQGAACDDGDLWTSMDQCDAAGDCRGQPYSCTPFDDCTISSTCDGLGGCNVSRAMNGAPCGGVNAGVCCFGFCSGLNMEPNCGACGVVCSGTEACLRGTDGNYHCTQ